MHGGTISRAAGVPWRLARTGSAGTAFSNTTVPGVVATLRPTSKADSSDSEMRPLPMSASILLKPLARLSPLVSIRSAARRVGGEEVGGRHGVDDLLHGKGNLLFLVRRRFHGIGHGGEKFGVQQVGGRIEGRQGLACQAGAAKRRSFSSGVLPAMKSVHKPVSLA
jgi:hypothetical protein